jgi:hypothetical protein
VQIIITYVEFEPNAKMEILFFFLQDCCNCVSITFRITGGEQYKNPIDFLPEQGERESCIIRLAFPYEQKRRER